MFWVITLIGLSGCAKDLVTGKKTYNWFSLQEDVKLGKDVIDSQIRSLKDKGKLLDDASDAELNERIHKVVSRIAAVSHYPDFPYESHYADVDVVNAWCAPGGKVMVYSGLFDEKKGLVRRESSLDGSRSGGVGGAGGAPTAEDEIAAVLGHEIAHATARHVTESLSRNFTIMTVGQIAVSAISASGAGAIQNAFSRTIAEGINLYIPYYSRANESEADKIGIMYMARAGYNPRAAVDLWYRACQKRGDSNSLYNSHPTNCQRAKDLEKILPEAQAEYQKAKER